MGRSLFLPLHAAPLPPFLLLLPSLLPVLAFFIPSSPPPGGWGGGCPPPCSLFSLCADSRWWLVSWTVGFPLLPPSLLPALPSEGWLTLSKWGPVLGWDLHVTCKCKIV